MNRLRGLAADSVPLALVPVVLVVPLGLDQGGFDPSAWVWAAAFAAWGGALSVTLGWDVASVRRARLWAALTGALLLWTTTSLLWSGRRTQTVLEARRTVVYVSVVLALALLARRGATRVLVGATQAAVTALVVYALFRYLLGHRHIDTFEGALLAQPLGYANAVGVLAAIGIALALGVAAVSEERRVRVVSAASVPVLVLALTLTQSRASWLALATGIVVTVVLERDQRRLARMLAIVTPPAAAAAGLGAASRLSHQNDTPWPHAGAILTGVAVLAAAAAAVCTSVLPRGSAGRIAGRMRVLAVGAGGAIVLAGAALVVHTGSTEPRASLWHVAWRDFVAHPVLGSGAGTFAIAWVRSGLEPLRGGALDAHSLYLEMLAELGIVGLLLLLAVVLLPLAGALHLRSRYGATATGAYVVFVVHAGLDWDWEMPAVVIAGLCCGAAVLVAAGETRSQASGRLRAVALAGALALGACAIAGARSHAEPGVAPDRGKAPSGAFQDTRAVVPRPR